MKEKSYEQVLEEFNDVDKVNNPSHYKGKFGLEAIEVVKNFAFGLEGVEGFYWGQRNQVHASFPEEKRS